MSTKPSREEHEAKTTRYEKRNLDGLWAAIAIVVAILMVLVVLFVAIKYGVD